MTLADMTLAKAVFAGACVVALALAFASPAPSVGAEGGGRYAISAGDTHVWRLDTETGRVSLCVSGARLADPATCHPWSAR